MSTCRLDDNSCQSVCTCRTGYSGELCHTTSSDFENNREMRQILALGLQNISDALLFDNDIIQIENIIEALNLITQNYLELNTLSSVMISNMITTIIDNSINLDVPYKDISNILISIDNLIKELVISNTVLYVTPLNMLEKYSNYALTQINELEYDEIYIYDTFNIIVGNKKIANNSVSLSTPLSTSDTEFGINSNKFSLLTAKNKKITNVKISLLLMKQYTLLPSIKNNIHSNPITVILPNSTACEDSGCVFSIALQTVDNTTFTKKSNTSFIAEKFITQCHINNTKIDYFYNCPNNNIVKASCDGLTKYNLTSYCPYVTTSPMCSRISSTSTSTSNVTTSNNDICKLVSYNNEETVCQCTFSNNLLASRRLNNMNNYVDKNSNYNNNNNNNNHRDERVENSNMYGDENQNQNQNGARLLLSTGGFQFGTTTVSTVITPSATREFPIVTIFVPSASPTTILTEKSEKNRKSIIIMAAVIPICCLLFLTCIIILYINRNKNKRTNPYFTEPDNNDKNSKKNNNDNNNDNNDNSCNNDNNGNNNRCNNNDNSDNNSSNNNNDNTQQNEISEYPNLYTVYSDSLSSSGCVPLSSSTSIDILRSMKLHTSSTGSGPRTISSWMPRALMPQTHNNVLNLSRKSIHNGTSGVLPFDTRGNEEKEREREEEGENEGRGEDRNNRGTVRSRDDNDNNDDDDDDDDIEYDMPLELDGDDDVEVCHSSLGNRMTLSRLFDSEIMGDNDFSESCESSGKYNSNVRSSMLILPVHRMSYRDPIPDALPYILDDSEGEEKKV